VLIKKTIERDGGTGPKKSQQPTKVWC